MSTITNEDRRLNSLDAARYVLELFLTMIRTFIFSMGTRFNRLLRLCPPPKRPTRTEENSFLLHAL